MSEMSMQHLLSHLPLVGPTVPILNPSTGKKIYDLPQLGAEQVIAAVEQARAYQPTWAEYPVAERARLLLRLHDLVLREQDKLMDLLQLETGKSRAHAFEEVAGGLGSARYYAKVAAKALRTKRTRAGVPFLLTSWVSYVPIGAVGVVTPWNYPLALAMLDVLPALVAGNTVVQKVDNQTALTGLLLRQLAVDAGLPEEAWTIVVGPGAEVGNSLTDHVDYIAFTGSTATGRIVAQRAAARLIGCSLELGGKNPMIVLPSANVAKAAEQAIAGAFGNSGQLCVSIERVYVPNQLKLKFEAELASRTESLRVGKSGEFDYDIGSLTGPNQLERVSGYVSEAVSQGARVLAGGRALSNLGPFFYAPTVLTDVNPDSRIMREEVFGPLIVVEGYDDIDEAIRKANDTEYGLNASVVGDRAEAMRVAHNILAGSVNINEGFRASMASLDSPMGGMKQSGQGRRSGVGGLLRFTEPRTIGVSQGLLALPSRAKQYRTMAPLMNTIAKLMRRL